jgi:hypothetical protein
MKIITEQHLFEEPVSEVADFAITWYKKNLIHKKVSLNSQTKKIPIEDFFSYT